MTNKPKSPMTNAERQAAYRARRVESADGVRFTLMAEPAFPGYVKRLAAHHGMTQSALLLRAVQKMEREALKGMTPAQEKAYYADI
jgi:hypothetical protein